MISSLLAQGATQILKGMDNRDFSAVELAQCVVTAADQHNGLNAVLAIDADLIIQNAKDADRQRADGSNGVLCGLPVAIKDNINTTGYPTTAGTTALLGHTPKENAPVIRSLINAGAYVGAKTNMHELAFGITSNNAVTGPVLNPFDNSRIPGGSSGGTAAAVAAGILPIGLGSDTGGSCRVPAALCGLVGFRPTTGRYNSNGVVPISHTRDTVGTIARTVGDVELFDQVLRSGPAGVSGAEPMEHIRLGVPQEVFFEDLEPETEKI
ncbi:MAG: indole acetimide hydrolase, partial [Cohaesibacteraceae bacterium]|nr:indole acetimide hydrolase [Cohaesibacteraceae bacterium]